MKPERFGNYVLLQRLGKGGMAEVFLARAQSVGGFEKLLAIKRLLPPYNIDQQIIAMLGDEARLSVWLNHPNIVQVLDFGRVGQTYYIAMEYVQGCDLCDLIRPDGSSPGRPLPLGTGLYVMIQVADALDYAHTRKNRSGESLGIIHRDVSPHNVLISSEGQVKLADFGLARATVSVHHSATGVIRGKFSYMPKEQARGKTIDHRIDLFAAGVTLYEVLTGFKPYTSTTLAQQLYQLEKPVPPPSTRVPSIPEEIDEITMQAMSPDPETRYSTAEELARDLRDALSKYSSFGEESGRLAELVRGMGAPLAPVPLPVMSLADLRVPEGSLIEDELRAAQNAVQQEHDVLSAPTKLPPPDVPERDDEDDGATEQFDPPPSAAVVDGNLAGAETVAMPPGSLPPAASKAASRHVVPRPTGPLPRPTGPAPRAEASDRGRRSKSRLPPEGEHALAASPSEEGPTTFSPRDTVQQPGRSSENSDDLDLEDARTIQRSPDEALVAFRRALAERERRKREADPAARSDTRLGVRAILILAAGGLLIFGIGVALGWMLPRQTPAPSITLKKFCPEVRACPPCVAPTPAYPSASDSGAPGRGEPSRAVDAGGLATPRRVGKQGFLTVTTGNAPARVYVDADAQSLPTPVLSLPLPAGQHRVRVYSEQHRTFSDTQWVTIKPGQTSTLSFTLE